MVESLGRRAAIAIDNARIYHDRDHMARTLQRSLLPPALPTIPGAQMAARYEPFGDGHEVGGDFYDAFSVADDEWGIVIGDVCGKGAEAAAVMGIARFTTRAIATERAASERAADGTERCPPAAGDGRAVLHGVLLPRPSRRRRVPRDGVAGRTPAPGDPSGGRFRARGRLARDVPRRVRRRGGVRRSRRTCCPATRSSCSRTVCSAAPTWPERCRAVPLVHGRCGAVGRSHRRCA